MIEKMKFLSITGPKSDIDRVVNDYLSKYEIHLENALSELQSVQNLAPYIQINPYKKHLNIANEFYNTLDPNVPHNGLTMSLDESIAFIDRLNEEYTGFKEKLVYLEEIHQRLGAAMDRLEPFRNLDCNLSSLLDFEFIRFRFGKISKEFYGKFLDYIYANYDTFFYPCGDDNSYVWGIYFCPRSQLQKIDAVYSSMHFEVTHMPDRYKGPPEEAFSNMTTNYQRLTSEIEGYKQRLEQLLTEHTDKLIAAKNTLDSLSQNFDVRKLAACTKDDFEIFYILCGWMSEKNAASFQRDIQDDQNLYCFIESEEENISRTPPTKLKNPKIFKPFEMFIRMYGLPAYNEIDPTIFVSLTYAFIFGAMFGDVGQGLCLVIGGFLLYKFKKMDLAAIIGTAGIFSTIFGFMFGSVFGFEDILEPIWLRPMKSLVAIPFIGTLNTVFIVAIGFGMFLILVTMIFHIINAVKARDTENIWFDHNALAGLVFYAAIVATVVLFMTGNTMPATAVLILMFMLPLLIILFKEPLTHLVTKKAEIMPASKGMFFVQGFFEIFEVLLSYFSNTLSFVRIGAFALSHAAMMEVVLTLAGAEAGGNINWIVIVLGNLFVCGMEGLIVGIQVLRLEYYELFSRFYKGTGREFTPFLKYNHKEGGHVS